MEPTSSLQNNHEARKTYRLSKAKPQPEISLRKKKRSTHAVPKQ